MATMGLRINSGGSGGIDTSIADVFAKAMFGDPDREMKFAQLQSNLATDEYQRRQIEAATRYNQAQAADKEWRLNAAKEGVGPAGKIIYDAQHPPGSEAPVPVDVPLPVETGAIPVPRMSAMPAVVEPTQPYSVGEAPTDPFAAVSPITRQSPQSPFARVADTPVLGNAPTDPFHPVDPITLPIFGQAPAEPFATVAPVPVAEPDVSFDTVPRGPDGINLAQLVRAQTDLPGAVSTEQELEDWWRNRPAPDVTRTVIPGRETLMRDRPPPPSLQDTVVGQQEIADRPPPPSLEPVPVDMETIGDRPPPPSLVPTPVAGFDRPPPPSLEQQVLPAGPAIGDRPPPVDPNYVPPAMAAPPTATGDVLPPPKPGETPETPVVTVGAADNPIPLTRDEANRYAAALIANGGDVAGAINKAAGGVGLTYGDLDNPARMRIAAQLATGNLASTSTVVTAGDYAGTDAAARQKIAEENANPDLKKRVVEGKNGEFFELSVDADGRVTARPMNADETANAQLTVGPYDGTSVDGQNKNVVHNIQRRMMDPNGVVTPEEAQLYDQAFNDAYGGKYETRSGPDETLIQVFVEPGKPIMIANPQAVYKRAGVNAPAAQPVTPPVETTTDAAGNVVPATAPAAAAPAAAPAATPGTPVSADASGIEVTQPDETGRVKILLKGKRKMTEAMARNTGFYITAGKANPALDAYTEETLPPMLATIMSDPSKTDWQSQIARGILQKNNPKLQEYWINTATFANAILRNESGAATRPEELGLVYQRFLPQPQDNNDTLALKKQYRAAVLEGLRLGAIGDAPTADELYSYAQAHVTAPAAGTDGDLTKKTDEELLKRLEELRKKQGGQ